MNGSSTQPDAGPPSPTPPTAEVLALAEAAEVLGVHYMTAYRYVRTGRLSAQQQDGRWQVTRAALDAFRSELGSASSDGSARRRSARPASRRVGRRATHLADRLMAGDEAGSWRIVDDALAGGTDLDDLYLDLIGAALRVVGDRWASGSATVADEHRASVVAMRVVGRLGPLTARPGRTRGTVVLAAAPGDRHALPSALLADLLRRRGLRVVDLGADAPPESVATAAGAEDRLVGVGLCATTPLEPATTAELAETVRLVRGATNAPVLLGGPAAQDGLASAQIGADATTKEATEALEWFEAVATDPSSGRARS